MHQSRSLHSLGIAIVFAFVALGSTGAAAQTPAVRGYLADSSLAFLAPLIGEWRPMAVPDSIKRLNPPVVAWAYRWVVGKRAIEVRESFRQGQADSALLSGLIYWNPATELVEFVAVAGHGPGQGRLFRGEYRLRADGAIEREYDVFYRTLADIPGEQLGGSRRRYREAYTLVTPDSIASALDWFHDGEWRPYGPFARNAFSRLSKGSDTQETLSLVVGPPLRLGEAARRSVDRDEGPSGQ